MIANKSRGNNIINVNITAILSILFVKNKAIITPNKTKDNVIIFIGIITCHSKSEKVTL